jgi:hypothetical protein
MPRVRAARGRGGGVVCAGRLHFGPSASSASLICVTRLCASTLGATLAACEADGAKLVYALRTIPRAQLRYTLANA